MTASAHLSILSDVKKCLHYISIIIKIYSITEKGHRNYVRGQNQAFY